ncbi:acetate--CoA ligase family protein [Dehalococcoidia bacterium]|nr:acetate--CoA ligase family protein [Dehalococcoidia bacterium]
MSRIDEIIGIARKDGRTTLTEVESKEIISEAGIEVVEARLARTKKEAISIAREMGFPVALKIVSPDIIHKSDCGGVKLGLNNVAAVGRAYSEIMASIKQKGPEAKIFGVSIQRMSPAGVEVIMGMSKDAQFGPVLMFGLGGVFVEVLKDVSFRIVPIARRDASQMIREIKGYPVLQGYRGQEPADITALENTLLRLSSFIEGTPEIRELDLNPVFAYAHGAIAADARVILEHQHHQGDLPLKPPKAVDSACFAANDTH